jgi:archaemetzincin
VTASGDPPFAGRTLRLLPLALQAEDLSLVSWLGSALASRTGLLPVQEAPIPLDRAWLDPARGQYSSNRLVDALIARADGLAGEEWTLAVTAADLFAPGRDFVFGEAALGGAWAVVSLARLDSPDGRDLLRPRLLVEALHELGHLAGLSHCDRPACAMARAAHPEHIDRKEPAFCPDCLATLSRRPSHPAQGALSSTLDR